MLQPETGGRHHADTANAEGAALSERLIEAGIARSRAACR